MSQFSWNHTDEAVKQQLSLKLSLYHNSSWRRGMNSTVWPGRDTQRHWTGHLERPVLPGTQKARSSTQRKSLTGDCNVPRHIIRFKQRSPAGVSGRARVQEEKGTSIHPHNDPTELRDLQPSGSAKAPWP